MYFVVQHTHVSGLTLPISISKRPPDVADRAIPGLWEGDLIQVSKNSYIVTLVERHSRFVMLAKISDNKTITVISALIKQARELPVELYKTLTWDRGAEMTNHTRFAETIFSKKN